MSLRLIEIVLPTTTVHRMDSVLSSDTVLGRWDDTIDNDHSLIRMLVRTEQSEGMLDHLANQFSSSESFRVMLLPVEATLPRPPEPVAKDEAQTSESSTQRISRDELYDDVVAGAKLSNVFIAQTLLATVVAAIGLLRNDTAIIIGAMVIAPLLGPNVSLCLATTLGDMDLAKRSLRTNGAGLLVTLLASLIIGFLFKVDPTSTAIAARTNVNLSDVILATASGCAGVLAFTTGAPASLIGVMVAVALLPPFTVFGLMLAGGELHAAGGALMLLAMNVICVNLAGVFTFAVQGVRPRTWWESERAKRAIRISLATWVTLLTILILLIYFVVQKP
ncbi:hypothetical protein RISK_002193 [Rhodopirellula islandica]|uniref:TIGR00341 family protein n=1 Tax=Rhodopirellula islandica TaxID=595434 RepID=A0A0J1BGA5_RHOIS|nr:TIGR00341 family protein [Rhodopirellula islandica]KLU05561.1 hypothetical protein RISK_002193 [Rhodopirellula islandica]